MTDTTTATTAGAADAAMATAATEDNVSTETASPPTEEARIWDELRAADTAAATSSKKTDTSDTRAAKQAAKGTEKTDASTEAKGKDSAGSDNDQQKPDIWANAPAELKAARDELNNALAAANEKLPKLEQENRSNRGRIAALQRQIEAFTKKDAKPQGEASDGKATPGFFETDAWKAFAEEYPELAAQQKATLKPLLDTVEGMKRDVSGITKERSEQAILDNVAEVKKDHGDYDAIKGSDEFRAWYEANKDVDFIREAVERNAQQCINPREVSRLLKMFKADTDWKPPAPKDGAGETSGGKDQGKGKETPADGGTSQTQTREQTRTETRRDAQIESSASPRSTGVGSVIDGAPNEAQAAWDYYKSKGL